MIPFGLRKKFRYVVPETQNYIFMTNIRLGECCLHFMD